jgi:hypothetical protein
MKTTMSVTPETLKTWRELADRSNIDLGKIMELIASDIKTVLDEIQTERISFGSLRVPDKKLVMLGFVPMEFGSFETLTTDSDKKVDAKIRKRLRKHE